MNVVTFSLFVHVEDELATHGFYATPPLSLNHPACLLCQYSAIAYRLCAGIHGFWRGSRNAHTHTHTHTCMHACIRTHLRSVYLTQVNSLISHVGDELVSTAFDVGAAARTGNARLLIKPMACFGVPLELIAYRECGDEVRNKQAHTAHVCMCMSLCFCVCLSLSLCVCVCVCVHA
jgi:hypothetical protein